jgi:hypothetical protein
MADLPEDVDPLDDLLGDLRAHGAPSAAWLAAHAPDRELGPVWRASENPSSLLLIGELLASRRLLATAACACARTVVDLQSTENQEALAALEVAEGWTRGEIADDVAAASMDRAWDRRAAAEHARGPIRASAEAIAWAAQAAAPRAEYANAAGKAAVHAAAARAATGRTARERTELYAQAMRDLAGLVRKVLSCPSLDALIEAARTPRP